VSLLFSGLIGALIGLAVTGGFHIWKLRRDELNARCDELCDLLLECGRTASGYWADNFVHNTKEMRVQEARILGLQALFEGLYAELKPRLNADEAESIDLLMSELIDAVSGGDFTVEDRVPDSVRTRSALQAAAEAIVAIRRAHHNTMPFARLARTYHDNRNRKLDMPRGWNCKN